jgi:hypothetical protein
MPPAVLVVCESEPVENLIYIFRHHVLGMLIHYPVTSINKYNIIQGHELTHKKHTVFWDVMSHSLVNRYCVTSQKRLAFTVTTWEPKISKIY